MPRGVGGWGALNFSAYVGSGLASSLHPQKYVGFYSSRCRCRGHEGGGGGGTFNFSAYVGSGLASTLHLKKISGISSTPKKYLKFQQPPKIYPFCTMILKRDPKMHRNDP